MTFNDFKKQLDLSDESIWRDFYRKNRDKIKIKKEKTAVANLVKIFNAVLSLSNSKGFSMMTLRNLSEESGLSMGALYAYFSSKDELLKIIQRQRMEVLKGIFSRFLKDEDDPRDKLRLAIKVHLFLSEIMQSWFYFSYMEAKNLSKEDRKKAIEAELFTERIVEDIIREGQKEGVFREVDATMVASLIKALLQDWYLKRWKYRNRGIDVDRYASFVIDFVESYICRQNGGEDGSN